MGKPEKLQLLAAAIAYTDAVLRRRQLGPDDKITLKQLPNEDSDRSSGQAEDETRKPASVHRNVSGGGGGECLRDRCGGIQVARKSEIAGRLSCYLLEQVD